MGGAGNRLDVSVLTVEALESRPKCVPAGSVHPSASAGPAVRSVETVDDLRPFRRDDREVAWAAGKSESQAARSIRFRRRGRVDDVSTARQPSVSLRASVPFG